MSRAQSSSAGWGGGTIGRPPPHAGLRRGYRRVSERVRRSLCGVMVRIRPQQLRIVPVPFMIEIGQGAVVRQARSGWVSLPPTGASVAMLLEAGLSSPELAAK